MARREFKHVRLENAVYFRDVYDHMLRITDMTKTKRELLAAMMESYLAVISNNLNMVMKKLAALAGIFSVPLLIAGIYGMNFKCMPELQLQYGYYFMRSISGYRSEPPPDADDFTYYLERVVHVLSHLLLSGELHFHL